MAAAVPEEEGRKDFARGGPYLGVSGAFGYPLFENEVEDILAECDTLAIYSERDPPATSINEEL